MRVRCALHIQYLHTRTQTRMLLVATHSKPLCPLSCIRAHTRGKPLVASNTDEVSSEERRLRSSRFLGDLMNSCCLQLLMRHCLVNTKDNRMPHEDLGKGQKYKPCIEFYVHHEHLLSILNVDIAHTCTAEMVSSELGGLCLQAPFGWAPGRYVHHVANVAQGCNRLVKFSNCDQFLASLHRKCVEGRDHFSKTSCCKLQGHPRRNHLNHLSACPCSKRATLRQWLAAAYRVKAI